MNDNNDDGWLVWLDACMHGWMDGWMDGWKDEHIEVVLTLL
jgi:hypothetical protein